MYKEAHVAVRKELQQLNRRSHALTVAFDVVINQRRGLLFVDGCSQEATAPSDPGPISLLIVSGNNQSAVVDTELSQPLAIKATNSKGAAIPNITVNFRVTSGWQWL